ncbi:MAG: LuxR C-terminal-related transcriptional regulator [Jiangellaceae bacterium]
MAEPPVTALFAAAERDVLLATKLHVPQLRPWLVPRPRLVERLSAGTKRELVLVCGPAGFGKSSLLAEWVRRVGRPVAWLSLDEGDNDPARFWRHVAAAVDVLRPGVAERVAELLGGLRPFSFEGPVTALVNELDEMADAVLVMDDYHLIHEPPVHQSLEFFLEHLPPALHLVLASRADPPLPLARLRARGQLTEVRVADLRFNREETGELLRAALGDLPDTAVSALGERTEGWVAGLQLAALSLQGHRDIAGFVRAFSGSHRYVLDYLAEEVLDRQTERVREFLLVTSVLERLSGPLCDAVRGRTDSQQLLEAVERANLFLHPLDDARRWWRYHHLFAELLRARLHEQRPAKVPELHRAAVDWCERQDLPDDAIRHALAGGDAARAGQIMERHLDDQLVRRNEAATLARWFTALPSGVVRDRPRLSLGGAVAALLGGRLDEVEPLLVAAERAFRATADEPYQPSVGRAASILANAPAVTAICRASLASLRGDPERARVFARQAHARLTDEDQQLGAVVRYQIALNDWMVGQLDSAERTLVDIFAERTASGERHMALHACYELGKVQQAQGRLGAALGSYRRGLEVAEGHPPLPSAGMTLVGLAEVLYERDELDAAHEHASAGVAKGRQLAFAGALVAGLLTLARIRQAKGDRAGALDAIGEAADVMPQVNNPHYFNNPQYPVPAVRAQLALANGDVTDAARWIRARGLAADDEPSYPREREYLVLARVLLAEKAPEHALRLLERWHSVAATQQRTGSIIELRALQALAHAASGDEARALAALAESLALGAPEGYLRVFVDEGLPMAALFRELLVGRRLEQRAGVGVVPREFLTRLAAAFEQRGTPVLLAARRGAVTVPGLVEPLSAREQEVLALLAAGRANRDIAEELVITLDTVKRHVSHLFVKLAVANRTQAVAQARQLGLLP